MSTNPLTFSVKRQKESMAEAVANGVSIEDAGRALGLRAAGAQNLWNLILRDIGGDEEFYVTE